jgi:hypothetical protein
VLSRYFRSPSLPTLTLFYLAMTSPLIAQNNASTEPKLTEEQEKQFLLHAKVIKSRQTSRGVTNPWRLTLTDGTLTHDAIFQPIDERKPVFQGSDGHSELNFRDSYHFNIAGYEVAKLLGLDNMVPVYVERKWNGNGGSIGWWVPGVKMDEAERHKRHENAPDVDAWNKQMYRVRAITQLFYDTDPNLTNVLITEDWKIWRIDFTRAFRLYKSLENPKDLVMCDRNLLENLRKLDEQEVLEKTKGQLSKSEVKAMMARRDKIVEYFEKLVAQKGEAAVLY